MFKDLCTDPDYDEELECACEPGNLSNTYAVAVKKDGDAAVVGQINMLYIYKMRWRVTYASFCYSQIFETPSLAFVTANGGTVF